MGLVDNLSQHPVGNALKVSALDSTFVVAQVNTFLRLRVLSASERAKMQSLQNELKGKTKSEQEYHVIGNIVQQKKLINAFRNCH